MSAATAPLDEPLSLEGRTFYISTLLEVHFKLVYWDYLLAFLPKVALCIRVDSLSRIWLSSNLQFLTVINLINLINLPFSQKAVFQ